VGTPLHTTNTQDSEKADLRLWRELYLDFCPFGVVLGEKLHDAGQASSQSVCDGIQLREALGFSLPEHSVIRMGPAGA
jgi:hypothetical protein